MAPGRERLSELLVVVDLTIMDNVERRIVGRHRLPTELGIHDGQPAKPDGKVRSKGRRRVVGTAIRDGRKHHIDLFARNDTLRTR
jgi:hypothetical protein